MEKQKNIPKLRFPEFEGEWEKKKLGEIGEILTGKTPSTTNANLWNGDIQFITPTDIEDSKYQFTTERTIKKLPKIKILPSKSIMFTCIASIGKMSLSVYPCVTNQQINSIIPFERYDPEFIFYALNNIVGFIKSTQKTNTVPIINKTEFSKFKISVSTFPEQQKIASFFTFIDQNISQLKRKLSLLEQYKKGVMQKIFSQEIRFKDDNGKEFPKWEKKRLGMLCKIVGGGTPYTNIMEYWNGEIQWFTPTEIKSNYVSNSERTISELGLKKSSAKKLPVGTILLTTRATIGDCAIAEKECATNQGFQSLIVNPDANNYFLLNWLRMYKKELIRRANGSTFLEISKYEIENIPLLSPSLPEQTKIANFLSAIDDKIIHTQKQIEKSEVWKKGLMQQMFV